MKIKVTYFAALFWCMLMRNAASGQDTMNIYKYLTLDSVVIADVRAGFDVNAFIRLVQNDTTFYQAFRNLRKIEYTSVSSINMYDKHSKTTATYEGNCKQIISGNCRCMHFIKENTTGDFYDDGEINYYTAKMFAYIFLYRDTICSGGGGGNTQSQFSDKKIDNRKDELKTLMFDPGKPVNGIPFMKHKTEVFDFDVMKHYDFFINEENYGNEPCYIFSFRLNEDSKKKDVVVQEMKTWFNKQTFQIVARTYDLQYNAGVYDFNVQMEVRLGMKNGIYIPSYINYTGSWDVPGKPRERGTVVIYIE